MNRRMIWVMLVSLLTTLATVGLLAGQEEPQPPQPPEPPELLEGPMTAHPPSVRWRVWSPDRAFLGVTIAEVSPEKARELKLPADRGALVVDVEKDSPAAKAGLEKDDVIVEFDGDRVRSAAELRRMVEETPTDRSVAVQVIRNGQPHTLTAKLETSKKEFGFVMRGMNVPHVKLPEFNLRFLAGPPVLGITGDTLTSQLARYFDVKQGKGVLVSEVMAGSSAEKAGLKAGDVITALEDKPVGSVEELREALDKVVPKEGKRKVALTVVRNHQQMTVPVELEHPEPGPSHRMAEAELLGMTPAQLEEMKTEVMSQADEARQAAEEIRKDWEKNRPEIERLSAEAQAEVQTEIADAQRQAMELHKQLKEQQKRMQGEWQRELQEEMKQLRKELKNNLQFRDLVSADRAI